MVIAAIGKQALGASSRPARLAGDRADTVDQRQELGDIVAIAAGQGDRERDPARVGDQMVLWVL